MKFIHAADLHIDSPMRGLARYEGAPEAELRGATRRAFDNLVQTAIDQDVQLVVLAGDIFDGDWVDFNTGLYFTAQIAKLTDAGIKVVMISGNHDAAGNLTKALRLPDGSFRLDHDAPQSILPDVLGLNVAVHGQSYPKRDVTTDLASSYPEPLPGVFNIGVLHTSLTGREGHDDYAPCTESTLRSKGYDYWALGHVHNREVVSESPWIVFPGNIQGRSIREVGAKGFTVVVVNDNRVTDVTHHEADTVRWSHCQVDVTGAESIDQLLDRTATQLDLVAEQSGDRLAAVRVTLSGQTRLHDELTADFEVTEAAVRDLSNRLPRLWVEKVVLSTRRMIDRSELIQRNDAMSGLFSRIESLRDSPNTLKEQFEPSLTKLRSKLPREARSGDGLDPFDPDVLTNALNSAESHILAALSNGVDE